MWRAQVMAVDCIGEGRCSHATASLGDGRLCAVAGIDMTGPAALDEAVVISWGEMHEWPQ